jgi:HSP20 family molecular chaperone IbpA
MKMIQLQNGRTWWVAAIVGADIATTWFLVTPRLHAADDQSATSSFMQKMQKWEDEMTNRFRDTFRNLRAGNAENSIGTASVDLREQPKEYVVRLNLPGRDLSQVVCALEGDSLHIVAPAEAKVGRYEQSIVLADAAPNARLDIKRNQKDGVIVVTVPKESPLAGQGAASPGWSPSPLLPLTEWDRQMFDQMRKMQEDMDRVFNNSFQAFRQDPGLKGFFDEPRFGSSIDVQEENGSYIVKAYLPNRDMQNVSVTVTNDTLKIEAKAQDKKEDRSSSTNVIHEAEYSQAVTLPGPVNAGKMKVDKKEGMLVITLPKANSK